MTDEELKALVAENSLAIRERRAEPSRGLVIHRAHSEPVEGLRGPRPEIARRQRSQKIAVSLAETTPLLLREVE